MLDQLFALSGNPGEMSTPPMLKAAELTQLYQALDWLAASSKCTCPTKISMVQPAREVAQAGTQTCA